MAAAGMLNVGPLVRERHPGESFTVGFGTHRGTVMAGSRWGAPPEGMPVPPAREDSLESLLHSTVPDTDSLFPLDEAGEWVSQVRGHRAIGVVYDPRLEWRGELRADDAFATVRRVLVLRFLQRRGAFARPGGVS
ncbi:erythromycin esterase family protein [Amycolatopsis methanolica]|uniref:erythromycin esterase family protein n=1 Tax=Amycolatopsis methanolica TaxID=1814 RepID=UPI002B3FFD24|nr:erythromycin esterase family protein [Amycolatopsis methanolica]